MSIKKKYYNINDYIYFINIYFIVNIFLLILLKKLIFIILPVIEAKADLTIRFIDCFIYIDPSLVKIIIVDANCSLPEIFILRVI